MGRKRSRKRLLILFYHFSITVNHILNNYLHDNQEIRINFWKYVICLDSDNRIYIDFEYK